MYLIANLAVGGDPGGRADRAHTVPECAADRLGEGRAMRIDALSLFVALGFPTWMRMSAWILEYAPRPGS
jgi:hypothetical protein